MEEHIKPRALEAKARLLTSKITEDLDPTSTQLLTTATERLGLSIKSTLFAIQVAKVIAVMDKFDSIKCQHIAEAIQYVPRNYYDQQREFYRVESECKTYIYEFDNLELAQQERDGYLADLVKLPLRLSKVYEIVEPLDRV